MTISEAIASEIQPYSTSDETLEKMFVDASEKFGVKASVADDYTTAVKMPVAYVAMRILYKMRPLSSESVGGISQGYKEKSSLIDDMIKSIAKDAGLDADLVLNCESDDYWLRSPKVW